MTSKEEAKQLIDKFRKFAKPESSGFLVSNEDITIKNAKQCSLIYVEFLGKHLEGIVGNSGIEYCENLKKEIEKYGK